MFRSTDHVADHVDDYLHDLLDAADARHVERHCTFCRLCREALAEGRKRLALLEADAPLEASAQLLQSTLARVENHVRGRRRRLKWVFGGMGGLVAAAAVVLACLNVHYLRLNEQPYQFQVLSAGRAFARSPFSIRVALHDTRKAQAASGVPVRVQMVRGSEVAELAQLVTDAQGGAAAEVPAPDWPDGTYTLQVIAQAPDSVETNTQSIQLARPLDVRVLGQPPAFSGSTGWLRSRLFDHRKEAAVTGATVGVELRDPKTKKTVHLADMHTDDRGIGQARYRLPDWPDGTYDLLFVTHEADDTETISQPVHLRRSARLMVSTDKPVYQPGQVIHVRGLALRFPDLRPAAGESLLFTIADPKGNLIFKRQLDASTYGIAAVDCALASEVLQGPYTIAARLGDTESKVTVDVHPYVLPRLLVDVDLESTPLAARAARLVAGSGGGGVLSALAGTLAGQTPKRFYLPGEPVTGTVRARYPFGNPVRGATVTLSVTTPHGITTVNLQTDAAGHAPFFVPQPPLPFPDNVPLEDRRIMVQATVRDRAGQQQMRTETRSLTAESLHIAVIPEGGRLIPHVSNTIYLYASQADGTPVPSLAMEIPSLATVTTNALGVASIRVTPKADLGFRVYDPATHRPLLRRGQFFLPLSPEGETFLVRTDRAVYDGGSTIHVTVLGSGSEPVFLDLVRDGQALLTDTIEMANGVGEHAIDLPPELSGTLQLIAYRFENASGLTRKQTRVLYVRPAHALHVAAQLEKEYRPRQDARIEFTLTDDQGKPTPGALSLAVVDEAVFSVLNAAPGMERTFYLLEKQLLQPVYTIYPWSPDLPGDVRPEERNLFEQALFASAVQTAVVPDSGVDRWRGAVDRSMADGTPAAFYGTRSSTLGRANALDQSAGLHGVTVAWMALAGVAALLMYVALWCSVRSRLGFAMLHVIGGLIAYIAACAFLNLSSSGDGTFTKISEAVNRGNFTAGSAPPTARDGFPNESRNGVEPRVTADRAPSGGTPAYGTPVAVRDWFPETLAWQPQLVTDDRGHATLNLPLADSITTWRLTGSAITADGRLGVVRSDIRVFQPFFVDANLPVALTRKDEVSVPVVVYNYSQAAQTVRLELAPAAWFAPLEGLEKSVTVPAGEVVSVNFRIRAEQAGTQELRITGRSSDGLQDAVRRQVEVAPDGRRLDRVANGTVQGSAEIVLDVPDDAIDGSTEGALKLYASSFSQLVEGLDGIFQMPYGCFEQTSSTTYPNVLALDYLRRTRKNAPEVEAKARQYIHLGYQRLLSFEVPGGGFDWFGRPPANVVLTAYGLLEFKDMARVHDVDPAVIARTRAWLLAQRDKASLWSPKDKGMLHEDPVNAGRDFEEAQLATTAYVAWAVFSGGQRASPLEPVRIFLHQQSPERISNPHTLALMCNAMLALEPTGEDAAPFLDRLIELRQTTPDGKGVFWQMTPGTYTTFYGRSRSGDVETTSLAALALIQSGRHSSIASRALAWIVQQKGPNGTWYSTQATVLALKALIAGTGHIGREDRERRIHLTLGKTELPDVVIPPDQADVMHLVPLTNHLRPGRQTLTLRIDGDAAVDFQAAWRYHVADALPPAEKEPLTVEVHYERGRQDGSVPVTATVRNNRDEPAPMVVLDLPVPAGFVLDTASLDHLVPDTIAKYQVTPRQVIVYLRDLRRGRPLELAYMLRATGKVNVNVAPARVYEYYSPEREAFSKGGERLP